MFKLLVLIILFIVLFPIVKMWMLMRRTRKQMQQAFEQAAREQQRGSAEPAAARRSRPVADEVGEYADFEEVHGAPREPQTAEAAQPAYSEEQQVVDAEFEDL